MSIGPFTVGYLLAVDLAAEGRIDRGDDPVVEAWRWLPPAIADAEEFIAGFGSWWEPFD